MKKIISCFCVIAVAVSILTSCAADMNSDISSEITLTINRGEMRGISANSLANQLRVGWNLGNSMDAISSKTTSSETSWGNPIVTSEMVDTVAAQGFNTIRIPCSWGNHVIDDIYTIDPEWINRVKEVCDYAVQNDMYIILNMHHEDDWLIPDSEHIDKVIEQFIAMWIQIAESFNEYGDHLILEGMNEPRVKGGTNEWNGGTAEGRDCINKLNQHFVDTVRSTGGNNEKRLLLITTFAAQVCDNGFEGFVFPNDDNIGVSLHAYTPYRFTYDSKGESWNAKYFDDSIVNDINGVFDKIEEFRKDRDIPVIITECGSVVKELDNGTKNTDEVCKWAEAYLTIAKSHNIPCVFWDNGYYYSGSELFGLLNRNVYEWYSKDIVDTITKVYEDKITSE